MKKNKGGRPSKIHNIDFDKVEELAGYGLVDTEIASMLDISEPTLNTYKKDDKFFKSIKKGKLKADEKVVKSLYKRACGYAITKQALDSNGRVHDLEVEIPADTIAQIFWLKNRKPDQWRDRHNYEVTGKDGGPVKYIVTDAPIPKNGNGNGK